MKTKIWIVDAFAAQPFTGNPAAVCILPGFPEDALLQQIAMEMNLSETAFLVKNAPQDYRLRWFTPAMEVNLCGHATLAATHILAQTGELDAGERVTYRTLSGDLHATREATCIALDFPTLPGEPVAPHAALKALGVNILACERNRDNYLVEVADYETLLTCAPDFKALLALDAQGVIVTTAKAVKNFDFASRYFGPGCGIDEDPVTGSAHCFLAPYWAKKLGKNHFHALQASKRQGVLDVTLQDERVRIAGNAITTLEGTLNFAITTYQEHAA